jgi:hypothetical protein
LAAKHPTKPLGIVDLLELYGFDKSKPTKFARHKDRRFRDELHLRHWLDFYQATQGKPVFDRCEQIIAFVGGEKTKSRFVGVYKVLGPGRDAHGIRPPKGYPPALSKYHFFYDLERQPGYERLENRIIVEWGSGTRLFHHWYNCKGKEPKDKEVLEILPSGQTREIFNDYLGFTITHAERKELYDNEDANREWRSRFRPWPVFISSWQQRAENNMLDPRMAPRASGVVGPLMRVTATAEISCSKT